MDFILNFALIGIGFFILAPTVIVISTVIQEEKRRRAEEDNLREVEGYPPKREKR